MKAMMRISAPELGHVKALRDEAPPETDGREGLRSLELFVAIYESA